MQLVHSIALLREALSEQAGAVFVPTMGNLHDGHLSLVRKAREYGAPVVVSIFVNRLQFAPHEDFDRYPRTLERDCVLLREAGCDFVFAPSEPELYPQPQAYRVSPPAALADILEGHFRPGFFTGVCTVVLKLFNIVQPSVAIFGKKDYQQLLVIRHMVEQLALPIQIVGAETGRADDGLALSSRNGYLSPEHRQRASQLWEALRELSARALTLRSGATESSSLAARPVADPLRSLANWEAEGLSRLTALGWQPDYLTVRRRADLLPPDAGQLVGNEPLVVLAAARIGNTRLIDNLEC